MGELLGVDIYLPLHIRSLLHSNWAANVCLRFKTVQRIDLQTWSYFKPSSVIIREESLLSRDSLHPESYRMSERK